MTAEVPAAPAARVDDIPASWDERTILMTMLNYVRDTVHTKCAGISQENATRAFLPSSPLMTICGLVSHLRWVEQSWIEVTLLGGPDQGPWTEEDPDREMRIAVDVPIARLLSEYRETCRRLDDLVAGLDLDTPSVRKPSGRDDPFTLRWILFHLIEETARHNGHLDLLRELADGVTGM